MLFLFSWCWKCMLPEHSLRWNLADLAPTSNRNSSYPTLCTKKLLHRAIIRPGVFPWQAEKEKKAQPLSCHCAGLVFAFFRWHGCVWRWRFATKSPGYKQTFFTFLMFTLVEADIYFNNSFQLGWNQRRHHVCLLIVLNVVWIQVSATYIECQRVLDSME